MRLFLFVALLLPIAALAAPERPNIVLILADDLGVGDLGSYNPKSKVPTPNLDALAAEGMRFTTAYCPVSVCTPTRYALMTGSYPWRSWKKVRVLANWERPMIEDDQLTLPGMLQQAGYRTAGFGKWHLGANFKTLDNEKPVGLGKFKSPNNGINIDLTEPITGGPLDRGFHEWKGFNCASEMLLLDGDRVTARIDHEAYEPLPIPGLAELPALTVEELLPRMTEWSIDFIKERAKTKDQPFFLYYAPYVPHIPLTVLPEFRGKTEAGDYGDYVHELDAFVGRLLATLDEQGLRENTLILFASDNGSEFESTGENHRPNHPLRGTKWTIHEGGIRTPLIARWSGRIPAGASSDALIALNDLLPSVAALIGQSLPPHAAPDGYDLSSAFLGESPDPAIRTELLMQGSGHRYALRQGLWKFAKDGNKTALFHLGNDPKEATNLAGKEPERLAAMAQRFEELFQAERTAK